ARGGHSLSAGNVHGYGVPAGTEDVNRNFQRANACVLGGERRSFNLRIYTRDGYCDEHGDFSSFLDRFLLLLCRPSDIWLGHFSAFVSKRVCAFVTKKINPREKIKRVRLCRVIRAI